MKNDFEVNTLPEQKKEFLKRIRGWIGIALLLTGMLLVILGRIIRAGFAMQKELDEIL